MKKNNTSNKEILDVKGVTKTFPGTTALDNVDFDLKGGEVHAVVGENGAGKSTLMHILAGILKPDTADVKLFGKNISLTSHKIAQMNGIGIVFQERSLSPNLTVAENILVRNIPKNRFGLLSWNNAYREAQKILDSLELDISPREIVENISAAKQQMVEIGKAISQKLKILILDEPTATITTSETEVLFRLIKRLKKDGIGIIYISHRIKELKKIADRVTVLKDGKKVGTYNMTEISLDEIVTKMVGKKLSMERRTEGRSDDSNLVLKLKNFSGKGFRNINLDLRKGEILTIAGLTGAGKSELALAIFGANPAKKGDCTLFGKKVFIKSPQKAMENGIGYLPEDRKSTGIFPEMAIYENIESANLKELSNGFFLNNKARLEVGERYVDLLNIATTSIKKLVMFLSGGNQQKVSLARWLLFNPKILIIDEPTRGIDVGAKAEIYNIIEDLTRDNISVIVISSDIMEILEVGNRILVMHEGKITAELKNKDATEEIIMQAASGLIK